MAERNAQAHFDVFVTIDRSLERQHDLSKFGMAFIVIRVRSNEIASYRPLFSKLLEAVEKVPRGEALVLTAI